MTPPAPEIEGLMLKRWDSPYLPGRVKGHWYKWKRDPYLVDAVLLYAQRGHGRRSSFYSDFTFAVWRDEDGEDRLTPVGKAYFGFTDDELKQLDKFVRENTIERFGPVRSVTPSLVLEVAFEGLQRSARHKSGIAMRFPGSTVSDGTSPQTRRTAWRHLRPCCRNRALPQARRRRRGRGESREQPRAKTKRPDDMHPASSKFTGTGNP